MLGGWEGARGHPGSTKSPFINFFHSKASGKNAGGKTNTMMDPSSLIPLAKASGRCPPSLIRDESIVEGGVFEMALLRALDQTQGERSPFCTTELVFGRILP